MKSLEDLAVLLLTDVGRMLGAPDSQIKRDIQTLSARVKHEGDSFLTITLPTFARDLERSLDEGRLSPTAWPGFGRTSRGLPKFMGWFLRQVFDVETGRLSDQANVACIRAVRQVCLFCKRIELPCSDARKKKAVEAYVACDDACVDGLPLGQLGRYFSHVARAVFKSCEGFVDGWDHTQLEPKHGPGATVERVRGNAKWRFLTWHRRLYRVGFSYAAFGRGSRWGFHPHLPSPTGEPVPRMLEPGQEPPVRVVLVPKTMKTPRVIAVEPVVMQYAQQGLGKFLVGELERSPLTGGRINFRDQSVNQELAMDASKSGRMATLDMSEASDRVSLRTVHELLASVPKYRDWVFASRTVRAKLPDGTEKPLKKFASMGSALCFPIEAMVFWTIIVAGRIMRAGGFPSARTVHQYGRDVFVYGDDIIVPTDEAPAVCMDLEAFGLKVNVHKSFWTGKFRESCGLDAFNGHEVTPVYLSRPQPTGRADAESIVSWVAFANRLEDGGYYATSAALRRVVEDLLGKLPQVPRNSSALGWWHNSEVSPRQRVNRALQRMEYLYWFPESPREEDPLDGDPALAKCLRIVRGGYRSPETGPYVSDEVHLLRSSSPYALQLKRRWEALY